LTTATFGSIATTRTPRTPRRFEARIFTATVSSSELVFCLGRTTQPICALSSLLTSE
jgi:hypothetical protein